MKDHAESDKVLFSHGSLEVEIYKPESVDLQTPHRRDEVYVIISGSGNFVSVESRQLFEAGEVLFVAAGVEHRFEEFTADRGPTPRLGGSGSGRFVVRCQPGIRDGVRPGNPQRTRDESGQWAGLGSEYWHSRWTY